MSKKAPTKEECSAAYEEFKNAMYALPRGHPDRAKYNGLMWSVVKYMADKGWLSGNQAP